MLSWYTLFASQVESFINTTWIDHLDSRVDWLGLFRPIRPDCFQLFQLDGWFYILGTVILVVGGQTVSYLGWIPEIFAQMNFTQIWIRKGNHSEWYRNRLRNPLRGETVNGKSPEFSGIFSADWYSTVQNSAHRFFNKLYKSIQFFK